VLALTAGQRVQFANGEDVLSHNVFSVHPQQPFDLGLTPPGDAPEVLFKAPGVFEVYCNIHPEMVASLLVLPNRRFAVVKPGDEYRISEIPPGRWKAYLWHRGVLPQHQDVELRAGERTIVNWEGFVTLQPQPHLNKHGRPYHERKKY
jgi:hypothetical protein